MGLGFEFDARPAAFLLTPGTRDDKQLDFVTVARCPGNSLRDAGGGVDLTVTVVATMAATSKYLVNAGPPSLWVLESPPQRQALSVCRHIQTT